MNGLVKKAKEGVFSQISNLAVAKQLFDFGKNAVKNAIFDNYTIYDETDLFMFFEQWLYYNYPHIGGPMEAYAGYGKPLDEPVKIGSSGSSHNDENTNMIMYRRIEGDFNIDYMGRKVYISMNKEKNDVQSARALFSRQYMLSAINGKNLMQRLLRDVMRFANDKINKDNLAVFTNQGDYWYRNSSIRSRNMDSVILPVAIKDRIVEDITEFSNSRAWYNDRGIPYKRTYMFTGAPGNGKSSLAMALASHTGRSIYSLGLGDIKDDSQLRGTYANVPDKSILLIEDIDSFISGRTITSKESNVTFSGLLNVIDGVFYKEGLITVVTTNHPENLDPALTRTGRTDEVFEIPNPGWPEIDAYLKRFYGEPWKSGPMVGEKTPTFSMSDIQEICLTHRNNPENAIHIINKGHK